MNKKEFANYQDAEDFVASLHSERKWAIDFRQNTRTGEFLVCWIEHKLYKAHDGKEFHDEIWVNQEGMMVCIQDMDAEHAKNALRLLLRNEREQRAVIQAALQQMAQTVTEDDPQEEVVSASNHTLH